MTARARELIQHICDAALADFRCYQGGRNVPQDVDHIQAALACHLEEHPTYQPGWRQTPALTERLLELYTSRPADYRAFIIGVSPGDELNPMEVLWQMDGIIGALRDDHDFVLWGEPGEQVLMHQDHAPAWAPGCNPDQVAEALRARLARSNPQEKSGARKSPRP